MKLGIIGGGMIGKSLALEALKFTDKKPVTAINTEILSGKVFGRSITVETSQPWLIEDIEQFLKYRQTFKYYCKLTYSKPNLKSYVKYLKQKAI